MTGSGTGESGAEVISEPGSETEEVDAEEDTKKQ
jgi:hypothetical protein